MSAARAQEIAASFDLRALPADFYPNPYPVYDLLRAGALVTLCIGAANRDPEQFDSPNRLDIHRQENRHLAFGLGIHQCAGLSLARLEGRVAIGRFLARFPDYRLTAQPVRGDRARFREFLGIRFEIR